MQVFVTGATGFIGSQLVPVLVALDHEVHVLTRDASRYDGPAAATVHEGDVLEPDSYREAMAGADAAYYLVHSMGGAGSFTDVDERAARAFADVATEVGLPRIVYLGGLGGDEEELSEHLASRRSVERTLADGSAELTVLRAAVVLGAGGLSFELIRDLVKRLPVMVTPRWVETPCQPIAVTDVVAYLVGVLYVDATVGNTFEIGAPEVVSYRVLMEQVGATLGRSPRIVSVPLLTPWLSSQWVGLVSDVPASVAKPLIRGLSTPVVVNDIRIRSLVPIEPTPIGTAIERAVEGEGVNPDDVIGSLRAAGVLRE